MNAEALEVLRELVAEVRGLRGDLAQRRAPMAPDVAAINLVRLIAEAAGEKAFSSWELVEHSRLPVRAGLRQALVAAGAGENCRRVGKLLQRLEGREIDGLRVVRFGADREGAIWKMRVS